MCCRINQISHLIIGFPLCVCVCVCVCVYTIKIFFFLLITFTNSYVKGCLLIGSSEGASLLHLEL